MLLAIAIISLLGVVSSMYLNITRLDNFDFNLPLTAILVISSWGCNTIVGIVALCVMSVLAIIAIATD